MWLHSFPCPVKPNLLWRVYRFVEEVIHFFVSFFFFTWSCMMYPPCFQVFRIVQVNSWHAGWIHAQRGRGKREWLNKATGSWCSYQLISFCTLNHCFARHLHLAWKYGKPRKVVLSMCSQLQPARWLGSVVAKNTHAAACGHIWIDLERWCGVGWRASLRSAPPLPPGLCLFWTISSTGWYFYIIHERTAKCETSSWRIFHVFQKPLFIVFPTHRVLVRNFRLNSYNDRGTALDRCS